MDMNHLVNVMNMIKLLNCLKQLLINNTALFENCPRVAGKEGQAMRRVSRCCDGVTETGMDFEVGVPVPSPKRVSGTSGLVSG